MMYPILKAGAFALLFASGANSPLEMKMLVDAELGSYPQKAEIMRVIQCESGFKDWIQSEHKNPKGPNGRENSWGLVQINLDYNPQVTLDQALDWKYSLQFIKSNFEKGRQWMWTCWRENQMSYGR